jgi:glycosyltransferase involved in cell wall biosynthesis
MIAYPFPPMGGSGVQRTVKFAKYLPEFGWEPIVLTSHAFPGEEFDYSLLDDLPGTALIHRCISLEPQRLLLWLGRGGEKYCRSPFAHFRARAGDNDSIGRKYTRFGKDLIDSFLFIPDRKVGWFPFALVKAIRILRREEISVIYSTSDPFTDHLVGYCLKKLFGKPWVADFRDPWTRNVLYQKPFRYRQRIDFSLEKRFTHAADRIVVVSEPMRSLFYQQHPEVNIAKLIVITNGYDPDDFDSIILPERQDKKFTITFVGRFSTPNSRTPAIFEAIQSLIEDSPGVKDDIRAVIVGSFSQADQEFVASLGLQEVVEIAGYQPHRKSIEYMLRSQVLLLTLSDASGVETMYTSKLFEYLAAKKPILGVMPECPAARLIEELHAGIIVPPCDVSAIRQAIFGLYKSWLNGTSGLEQRKPLYQLERRTLTASLARCLNEVIEEDGDKC